MEPRKTPPEYFLEIFADITSVKDVLKGLHSRPAFGKGVTNCCTAPS